MNNHDMQTSDKRVLSNSRLVSLPVRPENIFHFPDGLPAFETIHEFVVLCPPDIKPFFVMQSLEPRNLAFICIDPFLVCPGYSPVISEADVKLLGLNGPEDVFIYSIVTVTRDVHKISANLQGPIAINIRTGMGRQILCHEKEYPVRYQLWQIASELEKSRRCNVARQSGPETASHIVWPTIQSNIQQSIMTGTVKSP
jgi:flagellar assembly factor FliW